MDLTEGAFLREREDDDVSAIVLLEESDDQFRAAEKWERPEREGGTRWITYWIPQAALLERVKNGEVSFDRKLSQKQFKGILKLAGVSHQIDVPELTA